MPTQTKQMTSAELVRLSREYTFFSWSVQSTVNPIPVDRGEGVYFWDADGKRYLDFSSQLMNLNIGHQHPKVVRPSRSRPPHCATPIPAWPPSRAACWVKSWPRSPPAT